MADSRETISHVEIARFTRMNPENPAHRESGTSGVLPAGLTLNAAAGTVSGLPTTTGSYAATLAATGGHTPYTWSIADGSLPTGLTLSSAGTISGTPTTSGTSTFNASRYTLFRLPYAPSPWTIGA